MKRKTISILGSTGSIGTQALDICALHHFKVCGLVAHSNVEQLAKQVKQFFPKKVCVVDQTKYQDLKQLLLGIDVEILTGIDGMCEIAVMQEADIVLNAVVGMVGLKPTLRAIKAGKDIALANKETLVVGGELVMNAAKHCHVNIFPVDSEHSAIFQLLKGNEHHQINKIMLTASGGPFYKKKTHELKSVTIQQALAHPNWRMGKKISIDSATLMNKGLELIEAMWLFDISPKKIEVIIHPQSILHSAVEFVDYSVFGQMGMPDMKIPIQYALTYPERMPCLAKPLSLTECHTLTFEIPDLDTFYCLSACIQAAQMGGWMPAIVNAAGELATQLFLNGKISFLRIGELVELALTQFHNKKHATLEELLDIDQQVRCFLSHHTKQ